MEPNELEVVARLLEATGPYGLIALLWIVNTRTARALGEMHEQVVVLATAQTEAITKVEGALVELRETIRDVRRSPVTSHDSNGLRPRAGGPT